MLKVISVVDKIGTALDRLSKGVQPYHENLDYQVIDVHPKRPDAHQIARFAEALEGADIVEYQYFRTAEMLRSQFDIKAKQILVHNNPYSITESDWNGYDMVVGNNKHIYEELGKITTAPTAHIPLTVDTNFWEFKREWKPNKNVIMVANRIESSKGILPVAIACGELGLKLILVGAVSDMDYFESIRATGAVDFHEQVSDEALRDLYWQSTLHVCNSKDNFESGTMPVLEAMLCGVPVMSRRVGHVPELDNEVNMKTYGNDPDDVRGITEIIKDLMADPAKLGEMRSKGWETAKTRSHERRAYLYQKLYREVMWPDQKPVSVVVPVCDKPEVTKKCLNAINKQDYQNLEVIVVDDGKDGSFNNRYVFDEMSTPHIPYRYINTFKRDYGLARARNMGVVEATGEIIVFCDQRMIMQPKAVSEFIKYLNPKHWVYGNKGVKKEFVENFSAVYRDDLIKLGMFNERIDQWGGMSQEIRSRAKLNSFKLDYIESAQATPEGSSKNKHTMRDSVIKMKNRLFKLGLEL